ncbi:MAG: type I glutamate--ammonia ligase, partial [Lachnospiraceae bacterium]|nr:type I glutamate--ammonia ligase [Lachnospiraceae bacterium]
GRNLFDDPKDQKGHGLSKTAYHFMSGVLNHIEGMTLLTNPLVNSYKRLIPGYDAPIYTAWTPSASKSCVMRIPTARGKNTRIELRSPDSAMNPYLALAVILEAGLEGIEHPSELPPPVTSNLYAMGASRKDTEGIRQIPNTLGEAIEAFEADRFVRRVLGDHIYSKYLEAKKEEWRLFRAQVTGWEIDQYLFKY